MASAGRSISGTRLVPHAMDQLVRHGPKGARAVARGRGQVVFGVGREQVALGRLDDVLVPRVGR
eukprot:6176651-Pleurochrysis_carterae.AAC.2